MQEGDSVSCSRACWCPWELWMGASEGCNAAVSVQSVCGSWRWALGCGGGGAASGGHVRASAFISARAWVSCKAVKGHPHMYCGRCMCHGMCRTPA